MGTMQRISWDGELLRWCALVALALALVVVFARQVHGRVGEESDAVVVCQVSTPFRPGRGDRCGAGKGVWVLRADRELNRQ